MREGGTQREKQYELTLEEFKIDLARRAKKAQEQEQHIVFARVRCNKCARKQPENQMFMKNGRYCEKCYAKMNLSPKDFERYQGTDEPEDSSKPSGSIWGAFIGNKG